MWFLLNLSGVLIIISAFDEFLIDVLYVQYIFHRLFKRYRLKFKPLVMDDIMNIPEKKIAIMVPCWHEDLVIENMLRHNVPAIEYKNYDFFIGVYPNDEPTIEAVLRAKKQFTNIHCVISDMPGPTTKAQNLNNVYYYILNLEKENNVTYDIFVFHDSEDIIHPASLKLYSLLIPRKDMIQIPIFPLKVNYSFSTYWTYADEFAENHTKRMIIREAIRGFIPSAGVGTAFSRKTIQLIAQENGGKPFNIHTLTEDYSLALRIHNLGLNAIFLTQRVSRFVTRKKWFFFGKSVPKEIKEIVATRALFPMRYSDAVRQRARWITGIVFQEWWSVGWVGNFSTRYTLFLDRKGAITPFINFLAYISFFYWLIYYLMDQSPSLGELFDTHSVTRNIIFVCTIMMIIRLGQRAYGTYRVYGLIPALLSIPRAVYSNIINFHALLRAYKSFFFIGAGKVKWDKTRNTFPGEQLLTKYRHTIGELLLEHGLITPNQLDAALAEQKKAYDKLGKILVKQKAVTQEDITRMLAKQYNLEVADVKQTSRLTHDQLPWMQAADYHWMINNQCLPLHIENQVATIAIEDPTDETKKDRVKELLKPYDTKFVLLTIGAQS